MRAETRASYVEPRSFCRVSIGGHTAPAGNRSRVGAGLNAASLHGLIGTQVERAISYARRMECGVCSGTRGRR